MSCSDETIGQLIGRYELNLLDEEEKKLFEAHLLKCDACYEDLYAMGPVIEVMEKEKATLLEAIEEAVPAQPIESDATTPRLRGRLSHHLKTVFTTSPWRHAWSGAGLAVAAVIGALVLVPLPESYKEMAIKEPATYEPFQFRLKGPSQVANWQALFDEGMQFYSDSNYAEAIAALSAALEMQGDNVDTQFYLGVSHFLERQADSAIVHLRSAAESDEPSLEEKARWFLGNAYLLQENATQASGEFRRVVALNGTYKEKAEELLVKISEREDRFILVKLLQDLKLSMKDLFDQVD